MLTGGTEGTMYEIANEVFDSVVFTEDEYLDAYNNANELVRDELYEIVGEMIHEAERAMVKCAEANRKHFLALLAG